MEARSAPRPGQERLEHKRGRRQARPAAVETHQRRRLALEVKVGEREASGRATTTSGQRAGRTAGRRRAQPRSASVRSTTARVVVEVDHAADEDLAVIPVVIAHVDVGLAELGHRLRGLDPVAAVRVRPDAGAVVLLAARLRGQPDLDPDVLERPAALGGADQAR